MAIKLGSRARDKVTGFIGTIVSRTTHLTGCDRYCIQPDIDKDGKIPDAHFFDEASIDVLSPPVEAEAKQAAVTGPTPG